MNVSLVINNFQKRTKKNIHYYSPTNENEHYGLKYSTTTADSLECSEAMNLIRNLAKDGNYKISLLVAIGCFKGLRISDILALRWRQILNIAEFTKIEKRQEKPEFCVLPLNSNSTSSSTTTA